MHKHFSILPFLLIGVLMLSSCKLISRVFSGDECLQCRWEVVHDGEVVAEENMGEHCGSSAEIEQFKQKCNQQARAEREEMQISNPFGRWQHECYCAEDLE